jgi:hypothetical protein
VYDHDPEEVESLGWEEFIARQWESIFTGYRSWTGLRTMGRRWSDLIEVGLGCSQDVADRLVRSEVIDRPDRDLEGATDAGAVVAGMADVVADVRAALAGLTGLAPEALAALLERHAKFLSFIRLCAFGQEDGEEPAR